MSRREVITGFEKGLGKGVGQETLQPIFGNAEVDRSNGVVFVLSKLAQQPDRYVRGSLGEKVASVALTSNDAFFFEQLQRFVDRRARHPETIRQRLHT